MLNAEDKRLIRCICDAFPREHLVYHLLLTFKHSVNPEHYMYAGEYMAEKRAEKETKKTTRPYILNHLN